MKSKNFNFMGFNLPLVRPGTPGFSVDPRHAGKAMIAQLSRTVKALELSLRSKRSIHPRTLGSMMGAVEGIATLSERSVAANPEASDASKQNAKDVLSRIRGWIERSVPGPVVSPQLLTPGSGLPGIAQHAFRTPGPGSFEEIMQMGRGPRHGPTAPFPDIPPEEGGEKPAEHRRTWAERMKSLVASIAGLTGATWGSAKATKQAADTKDAEAKRGGPGGAGMGPLGGLLGFSRGATLAGAAALFGGKALNAYAGDYLQASIFERLGTYLAGPTKGVREKNEQRTVESYLREREKSFKEVTALSGTNILPMLTAARGTQSQIPWWDLLGHMWAGKQVSDLEAAGDFLAQNQDPKAAQRLGGNPAGNPLMGLLGRTMGARGFKPRGAKDFENTKPDVGRDLLYNRFERDEKGNIKPESWEERVKENWKARPPTVAPPWVADPHFDPGMMLEKKISAHLEDNRMDAAPIYLPSVWNYA